MANEINERAQKEKFSQWEEIGVDRIKAYSGCRLVGAPPEVHQLAWEWVRGKEQEADREREKKTERIVSLKPSIYPGVSVEPARCTYQLTGS
jgi:hypothetical protein